MKPLRFDVKRFGLLGLLPMVALLAGCPPLPQSDGGSGGPPSGVVEMDQNTDPRFFLRHREGAIGRIMIAGKAVRLDGRKLVRDSYIPNGGHVSTGPASAAIIEFFQSGGMECRLDIREFRHGRIYGSTDRCGHMVATDQGVMETAGWTASYHVNTRDEGVTVFTVINGEARVWRHADPSRVVPVPSYHQVELSRTRISPPRKVTPGEVEAITQWRGNFHIIRDAISVPDLRNRMVGEARRMLERLKLRASVNPSNAGSLDRVFRQYPTPGTGVKPGATVRLDARRMVTTVTVPDLRSRSLGDVRRILKNLGLGLRYSPRNATDQYWVIEQNPPSGRKVMRGTVVNVGVQPPIY